jgi:hypothetical protein
MRPNTVVLHTIIRRLSSERGFAMPTVLLALVASFGLASAAVVASVTSQGGSVRDQNTKAALGAAEAGASNALLRFNRTPSDGTSDICSRIGAGETGADEWCSQPISYEDFDRGSYTYWVRPTETELRIVSMGTVDGVTRRVMLTAPSDSGKNEGLQPFGDAGIIALDGIHLESNATIDGNLATNGNIGLDANTLVDCGYASVGPGKGISPNNGGTITCTPVEDEVSLPPVNPGDVWDNNSNDRICGLDPCVKVDWDPSARTLTARAGGSITLGAAGGVYNYALCQLTMRSNSYLLVAAGATVRLYFMSPEECGGVTEPFVLHSNSKVQPTGSDPTDLAILIVGSPDIATSVTISSNAILFGCEHTFVLYAPRTDVTLNSNVNICGGVAGKAIHINSNSTITSFNTAYDFELPNTEEHASIGYGPPTFVECSATVPAEAGPDAGC